MLLLNLPVVELYMLGLTMLLGVIGLEYLKYAFYDYMRKPKEVDYSHLKFEPGIIEVIERRYDIQTLNCVARIADEYREDEGYHRMVEDYLLRSLADAARPFTDFEYTFRPEYFITELRAELKLAVKR